MNTQTKSAFLSAEPQLYVADILAAVSYYERLGMSAIFVYGEPPFYAQVGRGGVRLNLRHVDASPFEEGIRERESLLATTITVDDVEGLFREFEAAAVEFHQSLKIEDWGSRTFIVKDPDGNLILFAGSMLSR